MYHAVCKDESTKVSAIFVHIVQIVKELKSLPATTVSSDASVHSQYIQPGGAIRRLGQEKSSFAIILACPNSLEIRSPLEM